MKNKTKTTLVALVILLAAVGLRMNAPRADLPSHITFSGSILTDEGNQCHNSRAKALYDEWYPDDWRITNYNPILPYIKLALFKVFGVGILQMRLVSHIFAFLSLLFFFLALKSYFKEDVKFALLGTMLLGVNFFYVMYNKIGTFETSITFWVILTLYFLEKYRVKPRRLFLVLSGASAFMGFIFKSIMAYLLPLPFAAVLLMHLVGTPDSASAESDSFSIKRMLMDMSFVLLGLLLLMAPWYLLHYVPNREWIISAPGQYMGKLMFPRGLENAWHNFLTFPWKDQFYKTPVVWVSALLFIPVFTRRLLSRRARLTEIAVVLFFFAHTFLFFVMNYRPTRYFIPLVPVMVFMTVLLFQHWYSLAKGSNPVELRLYRPAEKAVIFAVDTLWLMAASYLCFFPLLGHVIPGFPRPGPSLFALAAAALLVWAAYNIKRIINGKLKKRSPTSLVIPLLTTAVAVSLVFNLAYYWQWHKTKTYTVRDISLELGEKLENAYIGGMTSAVAVLENKHKALWLYPNFVNWNADTLKTYPLTHALLGADLSREVHHFFNQWPERMNRAGLLKVYHIKNYFLHLYSFTEPYIKDCRTAEDGTARLTIINPSQKTIKVKTGKIYLLEDNKGIKVVNGEVVVELPPGETVTEEKTGNPTALFYLDYTRDFGKAGTPLRYEAEIFPGRTGFNKPDTRASNNQVRYYDREAHNPGFLSYGPAAPYGTGVLVVEFKIAFDRLRTKLRPLCRLDIYSHTIKGPAVEREIKPSDIKKAKKADERFGAYRLVHVVRQPEKLEFRVRTNGFADVSLDSVNVRYYQGFLVTEKKN
jgi:4-amino-4-deoxy-L-arabinose transferase-like glycosyltransferase